MRVCKGNFPVYEHKGALLLVLLIFLGCLSLPPLLSVSLTSSPLSVSSHQEENADGFPEPAYRPSVSVGASACVLGGESIKEEGKTEIINSAACLAQGVDQGDILHVNAAPICPAL